MYILLNQIGFGGKEIFRFFHLLVVLVAVVVISGAGDSRNTGPEFADEGNPEQKKIFHISKKKGKSG